MKVFICFASTGEYSDRQEWTLHGYRTEQEAKDFVMRADEKFRELWTQCAGEGRWLCNYEAKERLFKPGWLPECPTLDEPDYTGFRFHYHPVEIKQSPP